LLSNPGHADKIHQYGKRGGKMKNKRIVGGRSENAGKFLSTPNGGKPEMVRLVHWK
jgi:hypothetical protein